MKVLQLIDSLRPGGAEKMAVNIANALVGEVEASYLCCTRQEGMLKEDLDKKVGYICLNKKHSLDLHAFSKLRAFIKKEQIDLVHAHGNSWFWGVLLKITGLNLKLVWHDHYGESENLAARSIRVLKPFSAYFNGVISVNTILKNWAENTLKIETVVHLNNFIIQTKNEIPAPELKGAEQAIKIICVANLRPQKDHFNLLKAFEITITSNPNLSLHLIGENPETPYSNSVLDKIKASPFQKKIFYYGSHQNIPGLLAQANIGVLSSRSEGLPLVLLEYGMAGLPVICTNVGQCHEVLGNEGFLVPPNNPLELSEEILNIAKNKGFSLDKGERLRKRIKAQFGESSFREDLLKFYKKI